MIKYENLISIPVIIILQTVMQELEVVETDLAAQKDALKHKVRQLAGLKLNAIDPKMSESVRPGNFQLDPTLSWWVLCPWDNLLKYSLISYFFNSPQNCRFG